jgi:hypothetical protein
MYLAPERATCLTAAEPASLIRSAFKVREVRTGMFTGTSTRMPDSESSMHLASAKRGLPEGSTQEMRIGPA